MKRLMLAVLILGGIAANARNVVDADSYEGAIGIKVSLPNDPNLGDDWSAILEENRPLEDIQYARMFSAVEAKAKAYFLESCEVTVVNYDEGDPTFSFKVSEQARTAFRIYSQLALGQLPRFTSPRASVIVSKLLCDVSVVEECARDAAGSVTCKKIQ